MLARGAMSTYRKSNVTSLQVRDLERRLHGQADSTMTGFVAYAGIQSGLMQPTSFKGAV
jgi:hypothetical protein